MPIYDYECPKCGKIFESIQPVDKELVVCGCGCLATRIISCSGVNCANEDAEWIRSVTDILPKDETATPMDREFAKNPTRKNYHRWMESRGLRPLEPGESSKRPDHRETFRQIHKEVWERHRARKRIEI